MNLWTLSCDCSFYLMTSSILNIKNSHCCNFDQKSLKKMESCAQSDSDNSSSTGAVFSSWNMVKIYLFLFAFQFPLNPPERPSLLSWRWTSWLTLWFPTTWKCHRWTPQKIAQLMTRVFSWSGSRRPPRKESWKIGRKFDVVSSVLGEG